MIKNLMIGNNVLDPSGRTAKVESIDSRGIVQLSRKDVYSFESFNIEDTKPLRVIGLALMLLGFRKKYGIWHHKETEFKICNKTKGVYIVIDKDYNHLVEVKYIHELQNAFKTLTLLELSL